MPDIDVDTLPAGRELDALIAEHWLHRPASYYDCPHFDKNGRMLAFCNCPDLPRFSTDTGMALPLLDEFDYWRIEHNKIDNLYRVEACKYTGELSETFKIWNTELSLAICRAVLKAALAEKEYHA